MKKAIVTLAILAMSVLAAQAQYTTLGIGISSPIGTLHVHSGTPVSGSNYLTTFHMSNGTTGTTATDGLIISQSNNKVTIRQYENADFVLTNSNGNLTLKSNGRIQTSGDLIVGSALVVNGAINFNNNYYFDANGNMSVGRSARIGNGFYCDLDGNLKVMHLKVTQTDWPDYVFGESHELMPINDVEQYVKQNGHLPNVPSAEEVEKDGMDVGEMNRLLLEKVEELTLYIIDLQKQLDELKSNK